MDEAQNVAGRVAVIARGRIVAEGPPALLGGRDDGVALIRFRLPTGVDPAALPRFAGTEPEVDDGLVGLRTAEPTRVLTVLLAWAGERGELHGLTVTRPSLEDVYLELTEKDRP